MEIALINKCSENVFRDYVLPEFLKENQDKQIKVWSAACSSGEEPYSLAMSSLDAKRFLISPVHAYLNQPFSLDCLIASIRFLTSSLSRIIEI
ncbi:hypothetical protein CUU64_10755 [Bacillus sp. V5-8f]|nr:hypothetical protein CUU64_10755 [Bacillus sp. V5-8f]